MTLLPIHIIAGAVAIATGFVSLYALKGAALHRKSGMIFVYAMLVMAVSGAVMAALKAQRLNLVQGVVALYLVTTALLTVRPRVLEFRWIGPGLMLVALAAGLYEVKLGFEALSRPRGTIDGAPAALIFIFGAVPLLAALGDLRMTVARGIQGARRIARHLWRMCFATFIATGSFFLGQGNRVIPKPIRIMPLLVILALLPLGLMIYWLLRVRLAQRYSRADRGIQL
jgi:uncharacterized membrane protein